LLIGGREGRPDPSLTSAFAASWTALIWRREVKMRWPLLPVILTSGHPPRARRANSRPVSLHAQPWQPLNVLIAADRPRIWDVMSGVSRPARPFWRSANVRTTVAFFFGFGLPRTGRRCRQHFPFGRKPVLLGLTVHAAMCGPHLIGAFANGGFPGSGPVRRPSSDDGAFLISHHN